MLDKFAFLIAEGVKNLWRHKITAVATVFSIFLTLFLIGAIFIATENSRQIITLLRSKYKIEVFFLQEISDKKAQEITNSIRTISGVRSTTLITKNDALRIFKDQFDEDIIDMLGFNPLPASCVVNIDREGTAPININRIITRIRNMDGVDEVSYLGRLISKIEQVYKLLFIGLHEGISILGNKMWFPPLLPILAAGVLVIAVLIIYNTIQLSVYSKRSLINALQLIGATKLFITIPFIIEGILEGIIASLITYPVLLSIVKIGNGLIGRVKFLSITIQNPPTLGLVLISLAVTISILGSYRAISRNLK